LCEPRGIERDRVADIDAEHERIFASLREHAFRQEARRRERSTAQSQNFERLAAVHPP
jgi:hypothetical protein